SFPLGDLLSRWQETGRVREKRAPSVGHRYQQGNLHTIDRVRLRHLEVLSGRFLARWPAGGCTRQGQHGCSVGGGHWQALRSVKWAETTKKRSIIRPLPCFLP